MERMTDFSAPLHRFFSAGPLERRQANKIFFCERTPRLIRLAFMQKTNFISCVAVARVSFGKNNGKAEKKSSIKKKNLISVITIMHDTIFFF
jgi:hypothetical protein